MSILGSIVGAIARIIHPDKPREWFANVKLPTDLPAEEISARLDERAKTSDAKDWRHSIVDLMKLTHTEDPDGSSDIKKRTALAAELGKPNYTGTAEENRWLHGEVFKAVQQRGIQLPEGS